MSGTWLPYSKALLQGSMVLHLFRRRAQVLGGAETTLHSTLWKIQWPGPKVEPPSPGNPIHPGILERNASRSPLPPDVPPVSLQLGGARHTCPGWCRRSLQPDHYPRPTAKRAECVIYRGGCHVWTVPEKASLAHHHWGSGIVSWELECSKKLQKDATLLVWAQC